MTHQRLKHFNDLFLFGILFWIKAFIFRLTITPPLLIKGILADLLFSIIAVAFVTLISTRRFRKVLFFVINLIFSSIWFSASIYFNYYGSVPTYLTLTSLDQVGKIGQSITASIQTYNYIYFVDILIMLMIYIVNKAVRAKSQKNIKGNEARGRVVLFSMIMLVAALIISGGLIRQTQTITNEKELARHLGIYHYQIAFALQKEKQQVVKHEISEEERQQLLTQIETILHYDETSEKLYTGIAEGTNVIMIQLEAFQNFLIGLEVNGQAVTPFLNEFVKSNFYFSNVYQQIGEGNTSDAEFLANTGAYPQGNLAMSKLVGLKEVPSLPRLLKAHQYEAYTFHVNDVTFWKRNELYPALGFTSYYDKESFVNDNFNYFGASDEELYRVVFDELQQKDLAGESYYAHLITTSSHHPFVIPEQYQTFNLPQHLVDTQLGHYIQAAHYVDEQLAHFVEKLTESKMMDHTTLVIYGDHYGLQQQDNPAQWVSEQLGINYHDTLTRFNIPLIIAVPNVQGEHITLTGGQVDILPTLVNLLGVSLSQTDLLLFGQDLLNSETNTIGIRYYMPTGTFINESVFYVPGDSFETGQAIDIHTFEPVEDLSLLEDDYQYILKLMRASDSYTSHYRALNDDTVKEGEKNVLE